MTIKEIEARNKQCVEVMLGAEYEEINGEIECVNVEFKGKNGVEWYKNESPRFNFDYCDYRIIQKPEMVELDFDDVPDLINQRVVCVEDIGDTMVGSRGYIIGYGFATDNIKIQFPKYIHPITFKQLREHFTRPDGSKFEKEKK